MPKKKQQKNGFYWFMQDIMPQLKMQSQIPANAGIAAVVPIAHPRWKALSLKEREKYEQKSRDEKAKGRGGPAAGGTIALRGDRLDNTGNLISARVDQLEEENKRRTKESRIQMCRWPEGNDFLDYDFYVIAFEYLCQTEDGHYLPCELGLVNFTLREGIKDYIHVFIKPGPIPLGYRFTCNQHSEETHQIPPDGFELQDDNYRSIWYKMLNFVNPQGKKKEYPPLYCLGEDKDCVEYSIEWLRNFAMIGREENKLSKVYELENMVSDMTERGDGRISRTLIIDKLTESSWDYANDTMCKWHEEREVKYCALGKCRRFVYAINTIAMDFWDIEMKPNKHLPQASQDMPYEVINPAEPKIMPIKERNNNPYRNYYGPSSNTDIRYRDKRESDTHGGTGFQSQRMTSFDQQRAPVPSTAPWAPLRNESPLNDVDDFPTLGATAQSVSRDVKPKYAGGREAPNPSAAPPPPASWHSSFSGFGRPTDVDEDLASTTSSKMTLQEAVRQKNMLGRQSFGFSPAEPRVSSPDSQIEESNEINPNRAKLAGPRKVNRAPGLINMGKKPDFLKQKDVKPDPSPQPVPQSEKPQQEQQQQPPSQQQALPRPRTMGKARALMLAHQQAQETLRKQNEALGLAGSQKSGHSETQRSVLASAGVGRGRPPPGFSAASGQ